MSKFSPNFFHGNCQKSIRISLLINWSTEIKFWLKMSKFSLVNLIIWKLLQSRSHCSEIDQQKSIQFWRKMSKFSRNIVPWKVNQDLLVLKWNGYQSIQFLIKISEFSLVNLGFWKLLQLRSHCSEIDRKLIDRNQSYSGWKCQKSDQILFPRKSEIDQDLLVLKMNRYQSSSSCKWQNSVQILLFWSQCYAIV